MTEHRRARGARTALLAVALALLAACGQTGPLFLPSDENTNSGDTAGAPGADSGEEEETESG